MPSIDLHTTPYAIRGSWLNVAVPHYPSSQSQPPEGDGLYLRSNRGRDLIRRELVKIVLLDGSQELSELSYTADHRGVRILHGGACVAECCFAGTHTLLISLRGGLGLRLQRSPVPGEVAHAMGAGIISINCRRSMERLAVETLQGEAHLYAPWSANQCTSMRLDIAPDQRGRCQVAIDAYQSTWHRGPRGSIAQARKAADQALGAFAAAMPPHPAPYAKHARQAQHLLMSFAVAPRGLLKRETLLMSRSWMDAVWSWDNCFNAIALSAGQPRLAWDQLQCEIDLQDADGAYPDAANDCFAHYNFSKPPVQGITYHCIQARNPRFWTRARLQPFYDSVAQFTSWWLKHRRWPGASLCHYLHGNDSGWDNSTMFDQGAPLQAPDLNAFLVVQMHALAAMAQRLKRPQEAKRWQGKAQRLLRALLRELWQGDHFVARRAEDGHLVSSASLIPWMPVVLGDLLPADIRQHLLRGIKQLITPWGIATERPDSPHYQADGYWRGPVWAPSSMLAAYGLRRCGADDLAALVEGGFCRACMASGFAENFDALSGEGLRDRSYTWTAAVFLCLAPQ